MITIMSLYQTSILKKHLNNLAHDIIEKIQGS